MSILPAFSKIIERAVVSRLTNYLTKLNIIADAQQGFRSGYNTVTALCDALQFITNALKNKKHVSDVFLDISKVFDTVDYSILLEELNYYGIRGISLNWFASYLFINRYQYVSYNNASSYLLPIKSIKSAIAQRSLIGPLIFLIFNNDLLTSSALLKFIMYADDTISLLANKNIDELFAIINSEL